MTTHETTHIEVTDTFGGEANYCWVRQYRLERTEGASRQAIIRRAKKAIGWTGLRCRVSDFGDGYEIRPAGICQVAFITFYPYGSAS